MAGDTALPVLICGAGIGGIALARGLSQLDVPCKVFERAPVLREVGSGLGLSMNGFRALQHLGIADRIREFGAPIEVAEFSSWTGRSLSRMRMEELAPGAERCNFVLQRADLHSALLDGLPDGLITTAAECTGFDQDKEGVTLRLAGGEVVRGSVLVGADGINSMVRRHLHGDQPIRYSGQTCYRGVAAMPPPIPGVLREVQGPGRRVGICPLDEHRVYWWAAVNAPPDIDDRPPGRRQRILEDFAGWPFDFPEMVCRTSEDGILRNDLVDRGPTPRWGKGRSTLVGDAAHPMLPNLGQGACTALEDAVSLARTIAGGSDPEPSLRSYEAARHSRITKVIQGSWSFGVPVRWHHPFAVTARELIYRLIPDSVMRQQVRFYMTYDVGPLSG